MRDTHGDERCDDNGDGMGRDEVSMRIMITDGQ